MGKILKYKNANGEEINLASSITIKPIRTWVGTAEEYDQITKKDPTTYYFITV